MQTDAQLANLAPENSLRHGVFSRDGNLMACDRCPLRERCDRHDAGARCALEAEYVETRTRQIVELPFIDGLLDSPAVSVLVWMECRIARAMAYLGTAGDLLPGAEAGYLESQPLDRQLSTLVNSYWRALEKLGLTPMERRKLASEGEDGPAAQLAAAIRELSRQERSAEEDVTDAEFTTEEGVENGA